MALSSEFIPNLIRRFLDTISYDFGRFLASLGMTWYLGGYWGEEVAIRRDNVVFK